VTWEGFVLLGSQSRTTGREGYKNRPVFFESLKNSGIASNLKIIELLFTVSKFYIKKIKIINIYIYIN
jgi:hypothetical protein